jgi:nucleotide-binding universal stress UspA family protein
MNALEPLEFRRVLVPVDESAPSQNALAVAAGLAHSAGSEVVLAHVLEPPGGAEDPYNMQAAFGDKVEEFKKSGEESLRRTSENETFSGLEVETRLLFGDPASALLEAAEKEGVDAIVMGSHGRGALGRTFMGSVSQKVVGEAKVPVVIVPERLEKAEKISG